MPYYPARQISGGPTPGALALQEWAHSQGFSDVGIYNPRNVRGSTSTLSLHAEGRAIDLTTGDRSDADLTALLGQLMANSANFGVQQIIWQRQVWRPDTGWRSYHGTDPHTSHAHVELTPDAAANLTVDMLQSGSGSVGSGGGGSAPAVAQEAKVANVPVRIPKDGFIVNDTKDPAKGRYVAYYVDSADLFVFFRLDAGVDFDTSGMEEVDRYWNGFYDIFSDPRFVHTIERSAQGLQGIVPSWGTFDNWYNHLMTTFVRSPEARADKGIQRLIMEMSFRPDMSEAEFRARMQDTEYWRTRNDTQREWNDLSPAEQTARVNDMRARLAEEYWQAVGTVADPNDQQIANWAKQVASGQMGFGAAVDAIRSIARRNPESPWSRTIRNEGENQRQRGQDIADMGGRVRAMSEMWGVRLGDNAIADWSKRIVENFTSEADLLEYLKDQSQRLYPGKDREVTAQDFAAAYQQVYEQILERPEVSLFNPDIQNAMQGNVTIADFERELKKRPEWLDTSNAFDTLNRSIGDIGSKMGFV